MKSSKQARREKALSRFTIRDQRVDESAKDYLVYHLRKEREALALGMTKRQFNSLVLGDTEQMVPDDKGE